jgi:hypothetical protein
MTFKEHYALAKAKSSASPEMIAEYLADCAAKAAKAKVTPYKKEIIETRIVTVGGHTKKATITLLEGGIKVSWKKDNIFSKTEINEINIPFETLSNLNFEDKTTDGHSMAGFGIAYHDGESSAQVIFFENGWSPVRKARKAAEKIESAYKKFFAGCKVEPLEIIDVNQVREKAANNVVHRTPQEK